MCSIGSGQLVSLPTVRQYPKSPSAISSLLCEACALNWKFSDRRLKFVFFLSCGRHIGTQAKILSF